MEKKIALVTGANSGMGMASARMLARKGYFVLMLVRSEKRGNEAFNMLNEEQPGCFQLILCDLSDLQSVRRAAASIGETYDKIDVMVNNAGVITTQRELTKEGLEMQFGVNHVGHFLLTMLLLRSFKKEAELSKWPPVPINGETFILRICPLKKAFGLLRPMDSRSLPMCSLPKSFQRSLLHMVLR